MLTLSGILPLRKEATIQDLFLYHSYRPRSKLMMACKDYVSYLNFIDKLLLLRKTREIGIFDNQFEFVIKIIMLTFQDHWVPPFLSRVRVAHVLGVLGFGRCMLCFIPHLSDFEY